MKVKGPEILKFLTFAKDEAPDTCKHATALSGVYSLNACSTIKWSADDVARENRLTDRLVTQINGATYSLYGQKFACFDQPSNDPTRVRKFYVYVK